MYFFFFSFLVGSKLNLYRKMEKLYWVLKKLVFDIIIFSQFPAKLYTKKNENIPSSCKYQLSRIHHVLTHFLLKRSFIFFAFSLIFYIALVGPIIFFFMGPVVPFNYFVNLTDPNFQTAWIESLPSFYQNRYEPRVKPRTVSY